MESEVEEKEIIKRIFKRKIPLGLKIISINDDKFLKDFIEYEKQQKTIQELIKDFDPNTDVIVPKSQLDITNQLKAIAGMANQIDSIYDYVDIVKTANVKVKMKNKKPASKEERSIIRKAKLTQPRRKF